MCWRLQPRVQWWLRARPACTERADEVGGWFSGQKEREYLFSQNVLHEQACNNKNTNYATVSSASYFVGSSFATGGKPAKKARVTSELTGLTPLP